MDQEALGSARFVRPGVCVAVGGMAAMKSNRVESVLMLVGHFEDTSSKRTGLAETPRTQCL